MPMPQKRSRRRRSRLQQGLSRRRLDEDGASLSESIVDSDSSSRVDGGSPPPGHPDEPVMSSAEPRYSYHQIIASRLARLQLPDGTDGESSLPSSEILEALTRRTFHDDNELRAAWIEYQCQIFLNETRGPDRESDSAIVVGMGSTYTEPDDVITKEEFMADYEKLEARMTEIDDYHELDDEQTHKLLLKHALYRIKACLLLKGKPVDKLDDVALEHKYPPKLIVENNYFFHYVDDGFFGWYFDSELCRKNYLSDYQRLVLLNDVGDDIGSWRTYRAFYSTLEADRDYLQYWEIIWLEHYVQVQFSSYEWAQIRSKAMPQALRIALEFPNMTIELAAFGFHEYVLETRLTLKDLDGIFFEIWKRINEDHQLCFGDALEQVYGEKLFPAHDRTMKYVLNYGELLFRKCTKGISHSVPNYRARELIAQEIHWRLGPSGTYERYARKKLKIAQLLGLIPKDKIEAA